MHVTACGSAAVIHDATVKRTAGSLGRVRDSTLATLETLDVGGWFGPVFAGARLPSLDRALAAFEDLDLGANAELKPERGRAEALVRAAAPSLQAFGARHPGRLVVSSFSRRCLAALAAVAPELPRGLLVRAVPRDWRAALRRLGCVALHADGHRLTAAQAAAVRAAGYRLLTYTVNDPAIARRLWSWGVEAVITDRPDLLLAVAPAGAPPAAI